MNSKERVSAALNFQKADRVPRYEIFFEDFISNWKRSKNLPESTDIYGYYKKIDIGRIFRAGDEGGPFFAKKGIERRDGDYYYERDAWGRLLKKRKDAYFFEEVEFAINEKARLDKLIFGSPSPDGIHTVFEFEKDLKYAKERFALVSGVTGLYMGCYYLRGNVNFLMDTATDVPFCQNLAYKVMDFTKEMGLATLERSNTWDTAIWVYDELASRKGPMISPDTFSKIFLSPYKEMISFWKTKGVKNVILHCDGNSIPLLEVLIEAGFTGIQSLAPTAGMSLPEVKKKYGNRLALIGGMDNIVTLTKGSRKDIENQAKSIVEVAKDGGVIIGTHSIEGDIPVENYDFYYSLMDKCDEEW